MQLLLAPELIHENVSKNGNLLNERTSFRGITLKLIIFYFD